jgi:hypothetical protein
LFVYCANLAKKLQLPNLFVQKSNNLDEIASCIRIKCLSLQKIAASQQKIQASLIFSIRFATSLQKIAASQHNIQASLIFCIRFATSLQKIAASQQYESKHRGTNDEKILKT